MDDQSVLPLPSVVLLRDKYRKESSMIADPQASNATSPQRKSRAYKEVEPETPMKKTAAAKIAAKTKGVRHAIKSPKSRRQ